MITQASITVAPDGGVLITLPPTGMDLAAPTRISLRNGKLRIGQNRTVFVAVDVEDEGFIAAIRGTDDLTVVEVAEDSFEFHADVAKV